MTTNREVARMIAHSTAQHAAHLADCPGCLGLVDPIEAALDEAEKRGQADRDAAWGSEMRMATKLEALNAILDKVVEMDTLAGRCGHFKQAPHQPDCIKCSTGLGPIARYVSEARG